MSIIVSKKIEVGNKLFAGSFGEVYPCTVTAIVQHYMFLEFHRNEGEGINRHNCTVICHIETGKVANAADSFMDDRYGEFELNVYDNLITLKKYKYRTNMITLIRRDIKDANNDWWAKLSLEELQDVARKIGVEVPAITWDKADD